jgi:LysM repeat protein
MPVNTRETGPRTPGPRRLHQAARTALIGATLAAAFGAFGLGLAVQEGRAQTGGTVETRTLGLSADGQTYTVQPGDTLETIARELDIALISLARENGLSFSTILRIGDVLIIPAGAPRFGVVPPIAPLTAQLRADGQGGGGVFYVVQPRDILDLIAAYYDVDLMCLAENNAIEPPYTLFAGQTLIIPDGCLPYLGLSSVLPDQLGGLNLEFAAQAAPAEATALPSIAPATAVPTVAAPTATAVPPTQEVPTRVPTRTPLPATATPIPPTATASNTPTPLPTLPPNATAAVTRGPTRTPTVRATQPAATPATPAPTATASG